MGVLRRMGRLDQVGLSRHMTSPHPDVGLWRQGVQMSAFGGCRTLAAHHMQVSASVGIAWADDGLWRRFSERDTFGRLGAAAVDWGTALAAFARQGQRNKGCHRQSAGTGSAIGDPNAKQQLFVDIIVLTP